MYKFNCGQHVMTVEHDKSRLIQDEILSHPLPPKDIPVRDLE